MIPKKFVRKYGEELRGRVTLKASGGAPWPVEVERKKGEVWLHNGWPEFATLYSLCFGYLLVFEYVERSYFRVIVFDPSATEIEYPLINCNRNPDDENSVPGVKKRLADDDSIPTVKKVVTDEISDPEVKKRVAENVKSSRCELTRACKKTRASSEEAFHNRPGLKQEQASGDRGLASQEEKERALHLAKAFESQNPFFISCLTRSAVRRNGVEITKAFKDTYRKWKSRGQVILQVGRSNWPVGCSLNGDRCTLNAGWMRFIRDNLLKEGDVCVFELINCSRKLFKVFIYRAKAA
ncbi:hypothetical protein AgCh_015439 [Apium graveolens]